MQRHQSNHEPHERVTYYDDHFEPREGYVVERNGDLTLVEDDDGRPLWLADFELDRKARSTKARSTKEG